MRATPKIRWNEFIDLAKMKPTCVSVCEHTEWNYRKGFRDGWLEAINAMYELCDKERPAWRGAYERLYTFWIRDVTKWFQTHPFQRGQRPKVKVIPTSKINRLAIWIRDDRRCGICGEPVDLDDLEIDHIIPWAQGGTNEDSNLQASHRDCNREKRDR